MKKRLGARTLSMVKLDTEASRRMWFLDALKKLENEIGINKQVKNIYFPSGTGSATNDPFWKDVCLPMLAAFAKTMHNRQVRVYIVSRKTYAGNENTGKFQEFQHESRSVECFLLTFLTNTTHFISDILFTFISGTNHRP